MRRMCCLIVIAATLHLTSACHSQHDTLPGFSCKANVAKEVRSAIAIALSNHSKSVVLMVGTYRGAFCATLGSKTDQVLLANLGGDVVPRAYDDLFTYIDANATPNSLRSFRKQAGVTCFMMCVMM